MPRRKRHEEHQNHEAWAIPYGDLMTLLLAFFVVMYAISSLNEGKYRVLSDSLFAAFRGAPRTMQPIQVGEKQVGSGADVKTTLVEQSMLEGQPRSLLAPVPVKTGLPSASAEGELNSRQAARARALQDVADQVARAMDDLVKANLVVIRRTDFWIEVEIKTDILFPSASAQLEPSAIGVIEKLGEALSPFPNAIRVEGHTDNRPIRTVAFISNWELSAARAGSVVRVLASKGVAPSRLAVIGYGENRPTQTNATPDGRNANRRVVVVILSTDGLAPTKRPTDPTDPTSNADDATSPGDATARPTQAQPGDEAVPAMDAIPPNDSAAPPPPPGIPAPAATAAPVTTQVPSTRVPAATAGPVATQAPGSTAPRAQSTAPATAPIASAR